MTQLDSELAASMRHQQHAESDLRSELENGHAAGEPSSSTVPQNADSATLADPAGARAAAASSQVMGDKAGAQSA